MNLKNLDLFIKAAEEIFFLLKLAFQILKLKIVQIKTKNMILLQILELQGKYQVFSLFNLTLIAA